MMNIDKLIELENDFSALKKRCENNFYTITDIENKLLVELNSFQKENAELKEDIKEFQHNQINDEAIIKQLEVQLEEQKNKMFDIKCPHCEKPFWYSEKPVKGWHINIKPTGE